MGVTATFSKFKYSTKRSLIKCKCDFCEKQFKKRKENIIKFTSNTFCCRACYTRYMFNNRKQEKDLTIREKKQTKYDKNKRTTNCKRCKKEVSYNLIRRNEPDYCDSCRKSIIRGSCCKQCKKITESKIQICRKCQQKNKVKLKPVNLVCKQCGKKFQRDGKAIKDRISKETIKDIKKLNWYCSQKCNFAKLKKERGKEDYLDSRILLPLVSSERFFD